MINTYQHASTHHHMTSWSLKLVTSEAELESGVCSFDALIYVFLGTQRHTSYMGTVRRELS